jgi:haloalkane dehalogenase
VGVAGDLTQLSGAFNNWRNLVVNMNAQGDMPVHMMLGQQFGPEIGAAYGAPFPDPSYKAGPLKLPLLVPVTKDDPANPDQLKAWAVFSKWEKPFLTAFGDSDPITRGADKPFLERVPGTRGQPHTTLVGATHFLQETHGEELAKIVNDFIAATPLKK